MFRTTRLLTLTAGAALAIASIAGPAGAFTPADLEPELTIPPPNPCLVDPGLCEPDDGPFVPIPIDPCVLNPALCEPDPGDEPQDDPGDEPQDDPGDEPQDDPGDEPQDDPGDEPQDDPDDDGGMPSARPATPVPGTPNFTG